MRGRRAVVAVTARLNDIGNLLEARDVALYVHGFSMAHGKEIWSSDYIKRHTSHVTRAHVPHDRVVDRALLASSDAPCFT